MRPLIEKPQIKAFIVFFIALLVLAVAPLFIENDFILDGFTLVFIWGAFAGAWNIIGGYTGMVSLGHNAFFGIGAYTSTLLGGALACLVGILLGIICFRLRSHYFALATLAFGQVTSIIAMNWRSLTNGAEGLAMPIKPSFYHMAFQSKLSYLYIGLALLIVVLAISYAIENSRLGYYLLAF
ncbi:MAG: branched-chain amino acid ABC transporter permease, partial [Deltaproteobacteria bacterium]|nr:branched-chain amino acid ABC transporter permease [Deltaproteobacteria bacterium]